jgi:hypothetical protein
LRRRGVEITVRCELEVRRCPLVVHTWAPVLRIWEPVVLAKSKTLTVSLRTS